MCTPYKLILNRMNNFFTANKMGPTAKQDESDVVVIGTCGAFKSLEDEAVGLIKLAKKEMKSGSELIVFGCLPGINMPRVKSYSPDRILPSPKWVEIESLIDRPVVPLQDIPAATGFRGKEEYRLYDEGKQFVLLQTGCSANCPFCPHKLGIGGLRSNSPEYILEQVRNFGPDVHTICLTGNDTGSYGMDIGASYPALLKDVLSTFPGYTHLSQVNADWAYIYREELWPLLMDVKVREFQVLIQSTSPRLLALMERKPVVEELKPYLKKLREVRKDLMLRTDLIVGFPTATLEEDMASVRYVADIFDEVAIHGFERFEHARIEKMGLPFHLPGEINGRVDKAVAYLRQFPRILIHRGGQVIKTLEAIEQPKNELRKKFNAMSL